MDLAFPRGMTKKLEFRQASPEEAQRLSKLCEAVARSLSEAGATVQEAASAYTYLLVECTRTRMGIPLEVLIASLKQAWSQEELLDSTAPDLPA